MSSLPKPDLAAKIIRTKRPGFTPRLGIVLGSGLGAVAEVIEDPLHISYEELPGFANVGVKGHAGVMILGMLGGTPVVCLQGRSHLYETQSYDEVKTYVRTLKLLGCEYFFATNAAGSLREDMPPGSLVALSDHINFQPGNPLAGPNDDAFGTRFPPMDGAYDAELREKLHQTAKNLDVRLHEGVYLAVIGPSYETAAEIRAFKTLGADLVGMSTVAEIIIAKHCGLKSVAVSTVTNLSTGLSTTSHDHNEVVKEAAKASENLVKVIQAFAEQLA